MFSVERMILSKKAFASLGIVLCLCALSDAESAPSTVQVEVQHSPSLKLKVTLQPTVDKAVEIFRHRLPWGTRHSMVIVAVPANGRCLRKVTPVEDPLAEKIRVQPKEILTGNIDLENMFPDIRRVLKLSEVQLFWAYEAPEELGPPHWKGGWILIPKEE